MYMNRLRTISLGCLVIVSIILVYVMTKVDGNIRRDFYKEPCKQFQLDVPKVYRGFLENLKDKGGKFYYAFIELQGYEYPILLLSDGVYQVTNDQEMVAMWTDVYYYDNGEVAYLGNVTSNGTAYPITVSKDGLFSAGGHRVSKYTLDLHNQSLETIWSCRMYFQKKGENVKTTCICSDGKKDKIITQREFDKAYKEYSYGTIVKFKSLKDCECV